MAVRSVIKGQINAKGPGLTGTLGSSSKVIAKLYASRGQPCKIDFYRHEGDDSPKSTCTIKARTEVDVQLKKKTILISSGSFNFECIFSSENLVKQWAGKIKEVEPGILLKGETRALESMIYEAIPDPHNDRGPFMVDIQQSQLLPYSGPAQLKFEVMEGHCLYFIDVFTESRGGGVRPVARWQVDHLRGYGASDSVLKFETGRMANPGPGTFVFKTSKAETIRQIIHYWAQEIARKRARGEQPSTTYESMNPTSTHNRTGPALPHNPTAPPRNRTSPPHPPHSTPSQQSIYQELLIDGPKATPSSSHYQALNPLKMETPPKPSPQRPPKNTPALPPKDDPAEPSPMYAGLKQSTMLPESKYATSASLQSR